MHTGLSTLFMALAISQPTTRDSFETANFVVYAADLETAKRVAESAEKCRQVLAKRWYGKEIADWATQCRIDVTIAERAGGMTEISFAEGRVHFPRVKVQGSLERILTGPLPHELTHVLFAYHFGRQPPRWADEGGAILAENESVAAAHRKELRKIIDKQRQFPMRDFLALRDYPSDIPCLYAQGHSVSAFLVASKGHKAFLGFVSDGLESGWENAVRERYGYESIEQMEKAWLAWATTPPEPVRKPALSSD